MLIMMPSDVENNYGIARQPVCGVLAAAIVCGKPFNDMFRFIGRRKRGNWKGSTYEKDVFNALDTFGVKYSEVHLGSYKGATLRQVMCNLLALRNPDAVYLVWTNRHVQVTQGLYATDQGGMKHISKFRWNRKKVNKVYKIENPKGTPSVFSFNDINNVSIVKKEFKPIMTERANSKTARAKEIYSREILAGKKRKEILSILMTELDTTWGSASTFYHKAQKASAE